MENRFQINTLYNLFIERYLQNLSLYSVPVNTTCGIHIGQVKGIMERCNLHIFNLCISDKKLNFMLLVKTFKDIVKTLPHKDRVELADEIGIDLENDDPKYISNLERKCTAFAEVQNIIDIQDFDVGYCKAPEGRNILLQVINLGNAESNCALQSIMNVMNKRYVPDELINNKLKITNKPWFMVVVFIILLIFVIGICLLKRKINLRYKYGSFLYV
ncbi:disulfide bond formation pathway protein [Brazilian porcupinepox virus 1]|nr:disulfide bond formation pathway protein [Brazilian porcupinepox virus 1]